MLEESMMQVSFGLATETYILTHCPATIQRQGINKFIHSRKLQVVANKSNFPTLNLLHLKILVGSTQGPCPILLDFEVLIDWKTYRNQQMYIACRMICLLANKYGLGNYQCNCSGSVHYLPELEVAKLKARSSLKNIYAAKIIQKYLSTF